MNNLRSKMTLVAFARQEIIEAMLAGISYQELAKGLKMPTEKIIGFAAYGARLEDKELQFICDYIAEANPRHNRVADTYDEYFKGAN